MSNRNELVIYVIGVLLAASLTLAVSPTQAQRDEIERSHVKVRENVSPPAADMQMMASSLSIY